MGLSYHFAFRAPETATPEELKAFLDDVEGDAKLMGFAPTAVVCGPFDTPERREFARRVARGFSVEDLRLKGVRLQADLCWTQHPSVGSCRLAPVFGCFLVVTNEHRQQQRAEQNGDERAEEGKHEISTADAIGRKPPPRSPAR